MHWYSATCVPVMGDNLGEALQEFMVARKQSLTGPTFKARYSNSELTDPNQPLLTSVAPTSSSDSENALSAFPVSGASTLDAVAGFLDLGEEFLRLGKLRWWVMSVRACSPLSIPFILL